MNWFFSYLFSNWKCDLRLAMNNKDAEAARKLLEPLIDMVDDNYISDITFEVDKVVVDIMSHCTSVLTRLEEIVEMVDFIRFEIWEFTQVIG